MIAYAYFNFDFVFMLSPLFTKQYLFFVLDLQSRQQSLLSDDPCLLDGPFTRSTTLPPPLLLLSSTPAPAEEGGGGL